MPIPRTDGELVIWYKHFMNNITPHLETLGITQEAINGVQRDATMLEYLVGELIPAYQAALTARTSYKNVLRDGPIGTAMVREPPTPIVSGQPGIVAPGIVPRLRQFIARIKAAPGYNETIGRALGIVGDEPADPTGPPKPTAKASTEPGGDVKIEFNKAGFDGVVIESRHGGEGAWGRLGTDNYSPYLDTRPPLEPGKPEVREYRLRYLERDEPVGEWSDIIAVTIRP